MNGDDCMFLLKLSVVLIAAELGGYICRKLKQPTVLGQLIMGIIIGPSLLGLVQNTETLNHLSELGVILLMFIAGLETDLDELMESGRSSTMIAIGGILLPLVLGIMTAMAFGRTIIEGFFIGVILTATSVSISVETLREIDRLKTKQGTAILGAAVIDDVIGIILLTLATGFMRPGGGGGAVFMVMLKVIGFFAFSFGCGLFIIRFSKRFFKTRHISGKVAIVALVFCLMMSFLSEEMGVASITGAYIAGIIISATPFRHKVSSSIQQLSYLLLTPIFFVVIGMKVDFFHLFGDWAFGTALLIAAVIGKLVGCGSFAGMSGFSNKDSLQIGIGMIPRGEVALIVTNIGLNLKLIPQSVFAAIVFMILATTMLTPPVLKLSFEGLRKNALKA